MDNSNHDMIKLLKNFFDPRKEIQKIEYSSSSVNRVGGIFSSGNNPDVSIKQIYQEDYVKMYREIFNFQEIESDEVKKKRYSGHLDQIEGRCESVGDNNQSTLLEKSLSVYKSYNFDSKFTPNLPILAEKNTIVNMINSNPVVIIQGNTGCGKSTQVPQFILDDCYKNNTPCNIIITQPRRIAAISLARRVSKERSWNLGSVVGYQVGMDKQKNENTLLLYMTTGVLLRSLTLHKHMNNYTHVILDEVHERNKDIDFALLVVKKLLLTNSPRVKVILMSATMDTVQLAHYFPQKIQNEFQDAPIISVEGETYDVKEYWLGDFAPQLGIEMKHSEEPGILDEGYHCAVRLIASFDQMEETRIQSNCCIKGSVLVFLPGLQEIENLHGLLEINAIENKWVIMPLHSSINAEEQDQVFYPASPGFRKIIISTNIAESSLTVPDIQYVIDFCLTKNLVCDPSTSFETLILEWATHSNLKQRRGRTGRTCTGHVYRMITEEFSVRKLQPYFEPEIKRCPLEKIILSIKKLGMGSPKILLAFAIEPPPLDFIERSILVLKEIGAMTLEGNEKIDLYDGELTFLGYVLEVLPVDIRLGRLIVLGYCLNCLDDCIKIAAGLSVKNIFSRPYKDYFTLFENKLYWSQNSFSDCIALLNAYNSWKDHHKNGTFTFHNSYGRRIPSNKEWKWANDNFIQLKNIREMDRLIQELKKLLKPFKLIQPYGVQLKDISQEQYNLLLKLAICGACYPNYFVQYKLEGSREINRYVGGHDPFNTVLLEGIPMNLGLLYESQILPYFKNICSNIETFFENSKAYIVFKSTRNDILPYNGQLNTLLYLAIKMRQSRKLSIKRFQREEEEIWLSKYRKCQKEKRNQLNTCMMFSPMKIMPLQVNSLLPPILPSLGQNILQNIDVMHTVDPGKFWIRYDDETKHLLLDVQKAINDKNFKSLLINPKVGMIVIAPFNDGNNTDYYRAKILSIIENKAEVHFVDYGNKETIFLDQLYNLPDKPILRQTPVLAFQCRLSEIKGKSIHYPSSKWSPEAIRFFLQVVEDPTVILHGRVFSMVHSVVSLELTVERIPIGRPKETFVLNKLLISKGFAEYSEEGYLSKVDNELRYNSYYKRLPNSQQNKTFITNLDSLKFPMTPTADVTVLRGPSSLLELSFYSLQKNFKVKVRIESDSVNSVILDSEPYKSYDKLLVATTVSTNYSGHTMVARNLTFMPFIPGFPILALLLFCPRSELKCDVDREVYTGILCGLGYIISEDKHPSSIFPEHDLEIEFDTMIDIVDIVDINMIRLLLNMLLQTDEDPECLTQSPVKIAEWQTALQDRIFKLFSRHREKLINRFSCSLGWNQICKEYIMKLDENILEHCKIFELHNAIELNACSNTLLSRNKMESDNF